MHMVVKVLVYAEDEEDALSEAGCALDNLCGEGNVFDYYNTFDNGWATERWGELPKAVRVCADLGSDKCNTCDERFRCYTTQMNSMLDEAMEQTKKEFFENLGHIKKFLTTHTDDELFEDSDFKFRCNQAGEYRGPCVWLYDQDGEGIREKDHLQNVLNRWACNNEDKPDPELEGKDIYIDPADVHY